MSYPVYYPPAGDVVPILFSTYEGSTGASLTMTGLAVTDIEIYKDGSATTRASDAGYTLLDTDGIDFAGITGIHGISIDTGDNTDAGFYTVGSWFHVVVSAITVDSQTVNFIAAAFRLMAAESVAGKPKVDVDAVGGTAQTAGDLAALITTVDTVVDGIQTDLDNATDGLGAIKAETALIVADTNELQGDWTNGGRLDLIIDELTTNVDAIETDTQDLQTQIGAAGAGLTAVPWNAAWDAEVQSEVDDALVAQKLDHLVAVADADDVVDNSIIAKMVSSAATADWSGFVNTTDALQALRDHIGDGTNLTEAGGTGDHLTAINLPNQTMDIVGNITGNLSGSVGSVTGTIGGLAAGALADMFDTDSGTTYSAAVAGSVVKEIADNAGGSALTEAGIADAVWNEAQADHVTAGSFGEIATEIASILVDTGTTLDGKIDTIDANVDLVLADTGTDGVVVAAASKTGYELSATGSAALTEGYASLGAAGTLPQVLYEIRALLAEKGIASTTLTTKKLDGSTTAATYTLDDATTPTSITRAS